MKNDERVIEAYLGTGLKNKAKAEGSMAEPFLIGEAMTGGYGAVDILHACTIAVEKGEIAVIVGPERRGQVDRDEGRLRHAEAARGPCAAGR